jgi:anaerobic selenocysteine-containing dehydrogenase
VRVPVGTPLADWPALPASAAAGAAPRSHAEVLGSLDGAAAALLYYSNPVYARAQPELWRAALAKVPLVVSFSPFLDETTAEVAHVVLPDATFLERYEDATPAPAVPRGVMGVRQPVVTSLHDTRATGDVVIELARAIGGPVAAAFPWGNFREAMEVRLLGLHAAERGTVRAPTARAFLSRLYEVGAWAEVADAAPQVIRHAFPSSWAEPAWEGDPNQYPVRMLVYRPLGSAEGGGANLPWLRTLRPHAGARPWTPMAAMHPDSAPSGVGDGEWITIESPMGSASIRVHLDRHIDVDTIAVPSGGGHTAFGRIAQRAGGINPMKLISSRPDLPFEATGRMMVRVRKGADHA